MNKEIKEKWIKALRSGEYEQGKNLLCRIEDNGEKKYCCLGVLCDLAVKEEVIPKPEIIRGLYRLLANYQGIGVHSLKLKDPVWSWAELDDFNDPVIISHLMEKNDKDSSFKEIANIIEEQL